MNVSIAHADELLVCAGRVESVFEMRQHVQIVREKVGEIAIAVTGGVAHAAAAASIYLFDLFFFGLLIAFWKRGVRVRFRRGSTVRKDSFSSGFTLAFPPPEDQPGFANFLAFRVGSAILIVDKVRCKS